MRWLIIFILIAFLLILVWIMGCVVYAYYLSHPDVRLATENRRRFANVIMLIDGTRSMREENFTAAKLIVKDGIIKSCGINDICIGYDIRDDFTLANTVFGGKWVDQPPQTSKLDREWMLEVFKFDWKAMPAGVVSEEIYRLIRYLGPHWPRAEEVRNRWASRVEKMDRSEHSNVCAALKSIQVQFRAWPDAEAEKWFIVLSDFINDPSRQRNATRQVGGCPSPGSDVFSNVNIVLIYPFDSASPDWEEIESYWGRYFGARELERVPFASALNRRFIVPPNPTSGLERYQIKSFCDHFWRLLTLSFYKPIG